MPRSARWRRPIILGATLLLNIAAIVPFLAGHSLHKYFDLIGHPLIVLATFMLVAFILSTMSPEVKFDSPIYPLLFGLFAIGYGIGTYRYKRWDHEFNRHLPPEYHPWAIILGISAILFAYAIKDRERNLE
jgi:hypothetical protein